MPKSPKQTARRAGFSLFKKKSRIYIFTARHRTRSGFTAKSERAVIVRIYYKFITFVDTDNACPRKMMTSFENICLEVQFTSACSPWGGIGLFPSNKAMDVKLYKKKAQNIYIIFALRGYISTFNVTHRNVF